MNNLDKKDILTLFFITLISLISILLCWGSQGNIAIDTGREFYIPEQMLNGQILYKDIFNIYGALAYQINMLIYKFFGTHTLPIHIFGNIVGLGIIIFIYLLSRQILNKFYSTIITIIAIIIGLFKIQIFNYIIPYSFAVTYGMLCSLISTYLLCQYLKNGSKKHLYWSVFLAGTAFAFKYDFFFYLLIYPLICYIKKENIKTFLKLIAIGLITPIVSFSSVIISGLSYADIIYNIDLFKKIANAPSLITFYTNYNIYLTTTNIFPIIVKSIITIIFLYIFLYIGKLLKKETQLSNIKKGILFTIILATFILFLYFINGTKFLYIADIATILFIINIKKIFNDKNSLIILLALFLLSIKSFFFLQESFYGIYYIPFIMIALIFILTKYYFPNSNFFKTALIISIICISYPLVETEKTYLSIIRRQKIKTEKGWISTASNKSSSKILIDIITEKTNKKDKIVILPEGHMINFLSNRQSDNFYGNLIPMYVEAFGEETIINHYKNNSPEYFILTDRNTTEYGPKYICINYAQNLCSWIFENYYLQYKILGKPEYTILRKKQ